MEEEELIVRLHKLLGNRYMESSSTSFKYYKFRQYLNNFGVSLLAFMQFFSTCSARKKKDPRAKFFFVNFPKEKINNSP